MNDQIAETLKEVFDDIAKAQAAVARLDDIIVKGDVAGHAFHGNQFTGGGGGQDVLAQRAGDILRTMGKTTISDKIDAHNQLAADHFIARNKALESGKEDQAKLHNIAGKGHMSAANAWRAYGRNEGGEATAVQRTQDAAGKSNRAAEAS